MVFSVLLLPALPAFSQATDSGQTASTTDPFAERADLEAQLKQLEDQISQYDQDITKTAAQKKTLQNQISLLQSKISKLNLQIKQGNLMITDLGGQITDTQNSIQQTTEQISSKESEMTDVIRSIYEEDQKSGAEILLSSGTLSDFFDNLAALEALNSQNADLLNQIKSLKSELEGQETSLSSEKTNLENVVKVQTLQKQQSVVNQKSQQQLLGLTEAQYQQSLQNKADAQKQADAIRARIFQLIGISNAPTFGQAYEIAKYVSGVTGVRPAFLLAMLTQESNLGQNVGQCYLKDAKTGSGVYITSGKTAPKTMNPNQIPSFLKIIDSLNKGLDKAMDPYSTPVSCVMYNNGQPYGWGGAMGPSQFIPTTWESYSSRVQAITGHVADPWDITDAFLATGLYLKDLGGVGNTTNEFNAAMHYFSGATWSKWEEFYGNSVLQIAAGYESDISQLEASQ